MGNKCCFIGHRNVNLDEKQMNELNILLDDLINKKKIDSFLFGSKSNFDNICLKIVSQLKKIYPNIKRIGYPCKNEMFFYEKDKEKYNKNFLTIIGQNINILFVDETISFKNQEKTGKYSYIKRNQEMINASDICIFYYDEHYNLKKSGTKIAYDYALKNKKTIINIYK